MISQTAWRVGRAFRHGKKSAPTEFTRIEDEANNLSNVLKLAAETLHADDSILRRADTQTVQAVWAILESAERSLSDLESFVQSYQIINRRETNGGYLLERSWSDAVLANYKTLKWTTEGGNIKQLQDMLQMHTNTISLTMQALQTRSLSRLEKTVMPMAENVASIHELVNGDLGSKIDDVHRVVMAVAGGTPSLRARDQAADCTHGRRQLIDGETSEAPLLLDALTPTAPAKYLDGNLSGSGRYDSAIGSPTTPQLGGPWQQLPSSSIDRPMESDTTRNTNRTGTWLIGLDNENCISTPDRCGNEGRTGKASAYATSNPASLADSPTSTRRGSLWSINEHIALAPLDWPAQGNGTRRNGHRDSHAHDRRESNNEQSISPVRVQMAECHAAGSPSGVDLLPSPALPAAGPCGTRVATPRSLLTPSTATQIYNTPANVPKTPPADSQPASIPFDRSLFRNAATLCDVRGTLVEYVRRNMDVSDLRYDTEMVAVCKDARVCVIRKRENRELGGTQLATSIWVLSDDGTVRCQQKLPELTDTIPYGSFFTPEKVSLAGSSATDLTLRCHGSKWSDGLEQEIHTGWVNYVLASARDANAFQSAVFGRTLLAFLRTAKTTVLHDGLKGVFAIEEQFAKMDRLRIWEEDGLVTAGAAGGVLALLHVSSSFGEGWARWWLNSSRQRVYVKADGEKGVKIKGLEVVVPGSAPVARGPMRGASVLEEHLGRGEAARAPARKVSGLRVEFETVRERGEFLPLWRRAQERMLPLPDL